MSLQTGQPFKHAPHAQLCGEKGPLDKAKNINKCPKSRLFEAAVVLLRLKEHEASLLLEGHRFSSEEELANRKSFVFEM